MQSRVMLIRALALGVAGLCGAQGTDADKIKTAVAAPPPFRVAVLYGGESTRNGSPVHKNDHDYTLNRLGWTFKKYARAEMAKLAEELDQYDLLLGCPLSATRDTYEPFGGKWRAFVDAGGGIALTDCCYPDSVTWLQSLGEGFGGVCAWGDCANDRHRGPARPVTPTHPIHSLPNAVEQQWQSWGHIKVSDAEGWERAVNCGCNKKLGITAVRRTGKGLVYLTSRRPNDAWPSEFENIRANLELQRVGLTATAFEMTPLTAGPGQVRLSLKSEAAVQASLVLTVTPEKGSDKPLQVAQRKPIPVSGTAEFTLPYRLSLRGPVRAVLCVVSPSGVSVLFDRKIVVPELLTLSPPVYRGLVPNVRRLKRTSVGVLISPDGENPALMRLQTHVEDSAGKPVCRAQDLKIKQPSFRQPLELPDNLPPGDYRVKAVLNVGGVPKAKAETAFTILEDKPGTAVVDDDLALITDGKPFFPLGIYHIGGADLPQAVDLGFNTVQVMDWSGDGEIGILNKAQELGLKVVLEIGNVFKYPDRIRNVTPVRDHPALLAWYGYDEPRQGNFETAMTYTKKLAQLDRTRPVFSVSFIEELFPEHVTLFDIFGIDPYCFPKVAGVGATAQAALKATRRERPLWTVVQSFGSETPEGLRCMAYLAVVNEAQGVFWYCWNDNDEKKIGLKHYPELYPAIKRICTELKQLTPVILGRERLSFRLENDKVQGLICSDGAQNRCLIVVNAGNEALEEVVLDIPNVRLSAASLKGMFDSSATRVKGLKPSVSFAPFEVKVFTW